MESLDQFFTPEADAKRYIELVDNLYNLSTYDNVIEPSAGGGSFFKNMPSNRVGIDLEPQGPDIIQYDFFKYKFPKGRNIVIGNPPYGRRGSMALKFINRCADYSDVIAFVLPRGFMRTAMQNSVDKNLHLMHSEMLENFNLPCGKQYKVKSVFQIWERRTQLRDKIIEPKAHKDFELLHKHVSWISTSELNAVKAEYPYAIGQNKLRIENSNGISKGSVWFVKPNVPNVKETFERATFDSAYYTTGAPSLSKGDIINGYITATNNLRGRKQCEVI